MEHCERSQPDIVLMDIRMQATALERGAEGYMLKSIHPREMKEALKLIYNGGTWIDHSVATRVFEEMKRQPEQLEKIGSSKENYPYGLTKREMEILEHLSNGLRYKLIAAKLFLSEGTIRNYCSNFYSKLDVKNREEAIEMSQTENIV